ncbi:MAG: hypothetical protein LBQ40_04325 [Clostridiales bacterium]|jgi:bifunctional N-acetylglucosamine-1-phosphate-uridyltransferase/glucosamine-1-phosphate-acetyltransferase GlmU-like protein|nr:hypothetical protein [Clostridiales bacterium]
MKKKFTVAVFITKRENQFAGVSLLGRTAYEHLKYGLKENEFLSVAEVENPNGADYTDGASYKAKDTDGAKDAASANRNGSGIADINYNADNAAETACGADYIVRLYSDMPLVTGEGLFAVVNSMNARGIDSLRLGEAHIFKRNRGGAERGMRGADDNFLSLDDGFSLVKALGLLRRRVLAGLIAGGVMLYDIDTVSIDCRAVIKKGAVIHPFNVIRGECVIGDGARIESGCIIENAEIGDNTVVCQSNLFDCRVGKNCAVGPFATLRAGADIGDGCRIGDFVEIKKSTVGDGVKVAHLAYIGDAEVGEASNIGCGTVFANYNGKIKQKTTVGKNVFVGANANLVAPLTIGDNSFIAAGSTITQNIPENAFSIAREKQVVKKDYAKKYRGIHS